MTEAEYGSSLYRLYHSITKLEAANLEDNKACENLTVNELNLIECIKNLTKGSGGPTISAIASELDITRPSTTVAVNKLLNKKIVSKTACSNDGRSVKVKLTAKGERAYSAHHAFQEELLAETRDHFSKNDFKTVQSGLGMLSAFLTNKLDVIEDK